MKQIYFKHLLTVLLLLCGTVVKATNFMLDGIMYTITDETSLTVKAGAVSRNFDGEANIPATVTYDEITYKVTAIAADGFADCRYLKNVVIAEGVTTIGERAFIGCSALSAVTIPKSLKYVGGGAFEACSAITTVNICDLKAWCEINFAGALDFVSATPLVNLSANPLFNWVNSLNDNVYGGWKPEFLNSRDLVLNGEIIKDLVIPSGVYNIAGHFIGCSAESVSFEHPDEDMPEEQVYCIGVYSFAGMKNLKKVVMPDFNANIGCAAFYDCTNLEELVINNNYRWGFQDNIGSFANLPQEIETFQGCTHLKKLIIKEGVNTLEDIFGTQFSYYPQGGYRYDILVIDTLCIPEIETIDPIIKPKVIDYTTEAAWYNSNLDLSFDCEVFIAGEPVEEKSGELVIPDGVKYIYKEKIIGENITKVVLPSSVTHIYAGAFDGCTKLSEINIPSSVTFIGQGAFNNTAIYNNCSENLLYIDNWLVAYKGDNLGSIAINEGTKDIADMLFAYCTNLTGVKLPSSISNVGRSAFRGCTALESIDFGQGITKIESYAFNGCTALTGITIPENVTKIAYGAFLGCTSLAEIKLHSGITKIESNAFGNTAWYNNHADGLLYLNNWLIGHKGDFTQESIVVEEGTTGIADDATFRNLSTVVLPKSLAYIGNNAFGPQTAGCVFTSHATTPPVIENNSIYVVNSYTLNVSIGKGIIDAYKADDYWNNFSNIVAQNTIGDFEYALVSEEENSVAINQYLGNESNVEILESVEINGEVYDVMIINDAVFKGNVMLTNITIHDGITTIGASVFKDCASLKNINLPNSITSIGASAFSGCVALTSIDIPNNVTNIESSTFSDCTSLKNIYLPNSIASIGELAFSGCASLENINLPNSITTIGASAFWNCVALTSIDIPNNVTNIESSTFKDCTALTSVYIPESVTYIESAFSGCKNIKEIYSNSATPATITVNAFDSSLRSNAILYIPTGSTNAYTSGGAKRTWGRFSNIVEMDFTGIEDVIADKDCNVGGVGDAWYDLGGRRVECPTKGVYIRNGKKVKL